MKKLLAVMLLSSALISTAIAQKPKVYTASEIEHSISKLNKLGSVLYLAAHPDDENTAALAYFSNGEKQRTAYLSLTRGDGGQNLVGPEKGDLIGMIRTQELLEARRLDSAEQFFTRAIDFGYTKTTEETYGFWGEKKVLEDIVWVIRNYRPDVIILRFHPDRNNGHGHHNASAILGKEAFSAAADPNMFPEQLNFVDVWQSEAIYWNNWRPSPDQVKNLPKIDTGKYDPLMGKSYTELSAESRSMHKSQGFGATGRRGSRFEYFEPIAGNPVKNDIFENIDTSWNRVSGGGRIGEMLSVVLKEFNPQDPADSVPALLNIYKEMNQLPVNYWIEYKKKELLKIIKASTGLWLEATTSDYSGVPGEKLTVNAVLVNRSDLEISLNDIIVDGQSKSLSEKLMNNQPLMLNVPRTIPLDHPTSQPYWLRETPSYGLFSISDQKEIGKAEDFSALPVTFNLTVNGVPLEFREPLLYRWTERVAGELYRPFEVRPPVATIFDEKVTIFSDAKSKKVQIKILSNSSNASGKVRLLCPEGWKTSPEYIDFNLSGKYTEQYLAFEVTPPGYGDEAEIIAEVDMNGKKISKSIVEISYQHIKKLTLFPESKVKVVRLSINRPDRKIGYIMGAGDEVPDNLRALGYDVTLLDDTYLDSGDFSQFQTIITGIRAYNTRDRLAFAYPRLKEFMKAGGTYIVQYNVSRGLVTHDIGPFPFTLSSSRTSVEKAEMTLLNSKHQLFNYPNKITQKDFDRWVQERGLYFASQWDSNYETVISSHDPNEPDRIGGTLFARYGEGVFIYSGYSWFRQLPAGVSGAYRLFVNMISAGKVENADIQK